MFIFGYIETGFCLKNAVKVSQMEQLGGNLINVKTSFIVENNIFRHSIIQFSYWLYKTLDALNNRSYLNNSKSLNFCLATDVSETLVRSSIWDVKGPLVFFVDYLPVEWFALENLLKSPHCQTALPRIGERKESKC